MNKVLNVKISFNNDKRKKTAQYRNLKKDNVVNETIINKLLIDIEKIIKYYQIVPKIVDDYIIDAYYNDIIAKSNRCRTFLKRDSDHESNDSVVGARFTNQDDNDKNHIITYYIDKNSLETNRKKLLLLKKIVLERFHGEINSNNFNKPDSKIDCSIENYSDTEMRHMCVDVSVLERLDVPFVGELETYNESVVLTFYKTEKNVYDILNEIKIHDFKNEQIAFYGDNTISIPTRLFDRLKNQIPYLISMTSRDLSRTIINDTGELVDVKIPYIPDPTNEPTIGVIDCLFDESVYFKKWVDNNDYFYNYETKDKDSSRIHGTEVSSIIVDGPQLNPELEDNCGRFRVRHFGVCEKNISITLLMKKIKEIVENNKDIHVWNLSLGTDEEVSKNYISYDAAILDEIQAENNCIFVISGTNDEREEKKGKLRVGSPADSLNSVVVNSVKMNNKPSSYSRTGPILSFFNKPDVSYYGGDEEEGILVCSQDNSIVKDHGSSLAAPWISRKLCYLIDVMKLPKEIAKALIIDSSANWNYKKTKKNIRNIVGYGVVPKKIDDILTSLDDEIKFVIYGTSSTYKTSFYSIPVPKDSDNKYPYIAKVTMCYFPKTSREQGVDYTNNELSIKFGRVLDDDSIKDIDDNVQDDEGSFTDERKSRDDFRKWENTKHIAKILKSKRSLISYKQREWGLCITSKSRFTEKQREILNFGLVITLKEINGMNRFNEFKTLCNIRGIPVNDIDQNIKLEVYNKSFEDIKLD